MCQACPFVSFAGRGISLNVCCRERSVGPAGERQNVPGKGSENLDHLDTFAKLSRHHARARPAIPAMRHKDRGVWRTWTWRESHENVLSLAHAFRQLGLMRGDRIAIAGANRPMLYWSMTAAQALGAIPVPLYADAAPDELAAILVDADARIVVAQDQEQVDKVLAASHRLPGLGHIVYDEPRGLKAYDHERLHPMAALIDASGETLARDPDARAAIESEIDAGTGDDISVILYTSGTTGRSKGVMLSAGRCIAAARDTVAFDGLTDADVELAYLPLAWVGDHYMNYAQAFVAGFCMACPEGPETVQEDLREIGPTFYFAPPRVFEGLLTRVMIRMEDAAAPKRWLFNHFLAVARRWGEAILDGRPAPLGARLRYALGELLIYGPLKNMLGFSRIRVAYTAGEAIGQELFSFYRSLGLNLKQLYGQTEAFLYVTCHANGAVRAGTVGPAAPNVELRLSDDGEVQFRSPGMFIGYYNDPAKTAEAMTADGFARTGDAGMFDADGQLRIIDRARDVGKLRSGAMFAPKYIENKLKFFPNIREAVVFGDGRDFVCAMINIDLTAVGDWAERNGIAYASYQELAADERVGALVARDIARVNEALAGEAMMAGAAIRRFLILHKELDADDGELTRTQKVRRGFIAERYAPLVAALYDGSKAADISTEVTFEDGRRGVVSARLAIRDMDAPSVGAGRAA